MPVIKEANIPDIWNKFKLLFIPIKVYRNCIFGNINNSFNILILIYSKGFRSNIKESTTEHEKIIQCIINGKGTSASNLLIKHFEKAKIYF